MRDTDDNYSKKQLTAHWLVVALVLLQILTNNAMGRAFQEGVETGSFQPKALSLLHALGGASILGLMIWRLTMRLGRGVPPPPSVAPRWVQVLSRANHWAFYVVLLAMPPVGLFAVLTLSPTLAAIHSATVPVLLFLAALHVAGAIYHAVRGDGTWRRMFQRHPHA